MPKSPSSVLSVRGSLLPKQAEPQKLRERRRTATHSPNKRKCSRRLRRTRTRRSCWMWSSTRTRSGPRRRCACSRRSSVSKNRRYTSGTGTAARPCRRGIRKTYARYPRNRKVTRVLGVLQGILVRMKVHTILMSS